MEAFGRISTITKGQKSKLKPRVTKSLKPKFFCGRNNSYLHQKLSPEFKAGLQKKADHSSCGTNCKATNICHFNRNDLTEINSAYIHLPGLIFALCLHLLG